MRDSGLTFTALLVLAISAAIAAAAPSISSVSGTVAKGSSITISGSGFGTKTTAAPVKYDNFDSGTIGNDLSGWTLTGDSGINPKYSTTRSHNGSLSAYANFETQYNCSAYAEHLNLSTAYASYWVYWERISGDPTRNMKFGRFDPGIPSFNGGDPCWGYTAMPAGGSGLWYTFNGDNSHGDEQIWATVNTTLNEGSWHRVEMYGKLSTLNQSDGGRGLWLDGSTIVYSNSYMSYTSGCVGNYDVFIMPFYCAHDAGGPHRLYTDDVYIDNTLSRVEIGNAPTWSACTHKEIQIPSAWNSNGQSITATVNVGSFSSSTAYLYVVDSANSANASGYPITLAGITNPSVTISATTPMAYEAGQIPGVFTISRTGSTSNPLTVNYTVSGTASSGDYTPTLSGMITVPAGASSATITVTPVDDSLVEGGETVILTITSGTDYNVGSPNSATLTIADSDGPTFIQSAGLAGVGNATSIAASFSANTATGNAVVVAVTWDVSGGASLGAVSDSQGHTYTVAANRTDTGHDQAIAVLYYVGTTAAANTVTVNFSGSADWRVIAIHEYSNIASVSPLDGSATNVATCTTATDNVTSTAATTAANGDLIFGVTRTNGGGGPTITAGTGFTKRESRSTPARLVTEDRVQTTAGSVAATFTFSQSWDYLTEMVALKPVSSAQAFQPGDCDKDYKIDGVDLATLSQNWDPLGTNGPHTWAQGDFNGDGVIDGIDLAALSQNWNPLGYANVASQSNVQTLSAPLTASPNGRTAGTAKGKPSAARRLVPWPTKSPK